MNEERFDRQLAELLDEETLLAVSQSLFEAKPLRRRVWRKAAAVAAAFVLLLGAVNYQSVVAFAQQLYYLIAGQGLTTDTPPEGYRAFLDTVEARDEKGGLLQLKQAIRLSDGTLWLAVSYYLPPEEVAQLPADDSLAALADCAHKMNFTLQTDGREYPLTALEDLSMGAGSNGVTEELCSAYIDFTLTCQVEGPAEFITLQKGGCQLSATLTAPVAVSSHSIPVKGREKLSFRLMQMNGDGSAIALLPQAEGLSPGNYSAYFRAALFNTQKGDGSHRSIRATGSALLPAAGTNAMVCLPFDTLESEERIEDFYYSDLKLFVSQDILRGKPEAMPTAEDCIPLDKPADGEAVSLNKTADLCGLPVQLKQIKNQDGLLTIVVATDTPYGKIERLEAFELGSQKEELRRLSDTKTRYQSADSSQGHQYDVTQRDDKYISITFDADSCGSEVQLYLGSAILRNAISGTYTPQ
ncbi:hypothetical protein [Bittarella massiliensis (ex Durand et al. 2017)]|uniref:hypothetical protein n=1 Tax=Bittarella massiliensis (ex Durand et al. 2017) TaxID=1720313 RepID=UPI001AA1D37F|nr:hypothetical protein [Bittarella massiliensis (ex Durand et al. 2017)]MBO1678530.1 hypothetical protein [Bittarella massiliensis (ex Durand et al. 2017)]